MSQPQATQGFSRVTPAGSFSECTYKIRKTNCGLPAIHLRMEVWHNFDGAECVIYIRGREWSDGIRTSRDLRAAINCGVPRKRREIFRKFDAFASSVIAAMGFEFKA